jgi:hypothetical protein
VIKLHSLSTVTNHIPNHVFGDSFAPHGPMAADSPEDSAVCDGRGCHPPVHRALHPYRHRDGADGRLFRRDPRLPSVPAGFGRLLSSDTPVRHVAVRIRASDDGGVEIEFEPIVFDLGFVGEAGWLKSRCRSPRVWQQGLGFSGFSCEEGVRGAWELLQQLHAGCCGRVSQTQMDSSLSWMRSRPGRPKRSHVILG